MKCDIKKFFANVDHEILVKLLRRRISDKDFINLLTEIITSFKSLNKNCGMPIGNLTSQLFANIYMDPLDQFVKHNLGVKYYIRYADDFVVMSDNRKYLEEVLLQMKNFLDTELKLTLHPNKIHIADYYLGVDFLGYVIFPKCILPRTKTKRRIFRKLEETSKKISNKLNEKVTELGKANQEILNRKEQVSRLEGDLLEKEKYYKAPSGRTK